MSWSMNIDSASPHKIVFIFPGDKEFGDGNRCMVEVAAGVIAKCNDKHPEVDIVAGVVAMPVMRRFAAVGVGVADLKVLHHFAAVGTMADGKVADVTVAVVRIANICIGADGVMALREACCVAATGNIDDESPCSLTFFLLPSPSVKEDFTLQPTATAALMAVCSSLSPSVEYISGLMAQWTAWIFSERISNPVITQGLEEPEACNNDDIIRSSTMSLTALLFC
jgi:hypothetical protein